MILTYYRMFCVVKCAFKIYVLVRRRFHESILPFLKACAVRPSECFPSIIVRIHIHFAANRNGRPAGREKRPHRDQTGSLSNRRERKWTKR